MHHMNLLQERLKIGQNGLEIEHNRKLEEEEVCVSSSPGSVVEEKGLSIPLGSPLRLLLYQKYLVHSLSKLT